MPIYEYYCEPCSHRFEVKRPMSESDKDADCPICRDKAKRALSKFACFTVTPGEGSAPIAGAGGGCSDCGSSSCTS